MAQTYERTKKRSAISSFHESSWWLFCVETSLVYKAETELDYSPKEDKSGFPIQLEDIKNKTLT